MSRNNFVRQLIRNRVCFSKVSCVAVSLHSSLLLARCIVAQMWPPQFAYSFNLFDLDQPPQPPSLGHVFLLVVRHRTHAVRSLTTSTSNPVLSLSLSLAISSMWYEYQHAFALTCNVRPQFGSIQLDICSWAFAIRRLQFKLVHSFVSSLAFIFTFAPVLLSISCASTVRRLRSRLVRILTLSHFRCRCSNCPSRSFRPIRLVLLNLVRRFLSVVPLSDRILSAIRNPFDSDTFSCCASCRTRLDSIRCVGHHFVRSTLFSPLRTVAVKDRRDTSKSTRYRFSRYSDCDRFQGQSVTATSLSFVKSKNKN